mmetsp:Transcript_64949/g.203503  ORF Transcript_64949/g.203503 Transcript_64949/m.203503 type:complete len:236 (+) Transcript_64949:74-781(+)
MNVADVKNSRGLVCLCLVPRDHLWYRLVDVSVFQTLPMVLIGQIPTSCNTVCAAGHRGGRGSNRFKLFVPMTFAGGTSLRTGSPITRGPGTAGCVFPGGSPMGRPAAVGDGSESFEVPSKTVGTDDALESLALLGASSAPEPPPLPLPRCKPSFRLVPTCRSETSAKASSSIGPQGSSTPCGEHPSPQLQAAPWDAASPEAECASAPAAPHKSLVTNAVELAAAESRIATTDIAL